MIKAERRWAWLILALLLAAEVRLFSGSLGKFFDQDSLFYLVNHPRTWEQFLRLLAGPDVSQQYRPLTLGALGLVIPWLGTDPYLYHWIPMLFHGLNTVLLFVLGRKLSRDSWSALAVTAFWAFHSAAGIVTSGIAFISDFLMAALLLSPR